MLMGSMFERFAKDHPFAVMSQTLLERALPAEKLDDLFKQEADSQYTRKLLFSSVVDLMSEVVMSAQPSVRAAYVHKDCKITVSLTAVYDKLQGIEPQVSAALVDHVDQQLQPLIRELGGALPELIPGFPMNVLDGNALAATEHRLLETRANSAAPLPGKSLCVFSPSLQLITRVIPCEDGHAQERSLVDPILDSMEKGSLWVADRNFCFQRFLLGIANRSAYFVIRHHKSLNFKVLSELRKRGRCETGVVFQQSIQVEDEEGNKIRVRRVVVQLHKATEDGDLELVILTNLPRRVKPSTVAEAYRKRWTIEGGFLDLTTTLQCEIKPLCYPRAALFAFCVAVLAYNMHSTLKAVMRIEHGDETVEKELSRYYMANEIEKTYQGMLTALPPEEWSVFRTMSLADYAAFLRRVAKGVDLECYPKSHRSTEKKKVTRKFDPKHPHVSAQKILRKRKPAMTC